MESKLKPYPAPWKGRLLLACRKCQKKLKTSDKHLSSLKKAVKTRNKQFPDDPLHVLNIPCMDVCPKHAVAVCLSRNGNEQLFILRSPEDLSQL